MRKPLPVMELVKRNIQHTRDAGKNSIPFSALVARVRSNPDRVKRALSDLKRKGLHTSFEKVGRGTLVLF